MNNSKDPADITLSFASDKEAIIALKSVIRIDLGDDPKLKSIQLEPTPGFRKYLLNLSSSLKLQPAPKIPASTVEKVSEVNSVQKFSVPVVPKQVEAPDRREEAKSDNSKSKETEVGLKSQKLLITGSSKRNEVPLSIVKPAKLVKRFILTSIFPSYFFK